MTERTFFQVEPSQVDESDERPLLIISIFYAYHLIVALALLALGRMTIECTATIVVVMALTLSAHRRARVRATDG